MREKESTMESEMILQPLRANMVLSTGTVIIHRRMANGAQEALIQGREHEGMTNAEWEEYCLAIRIGNRR